MHGCKTAICQVDETSCNTRPEHTVGSRAPFEKSASHFWCARLADHLARPLDFALGPEAASCSADVHKLGIYLITSSARAGNAGDNYDARCIRLSPDADVMRSSEVFARCQKQPKTHRPAHYRVESIRFCSRGARLRSNSSSMIGRLMCSIPDSAAGSCGLLPARVSLSHCFHSSVW
jgi:hypothetical protein